MIESKKILDAGCGVGRFIYHVSKTQPENEFWGVDISAENIAEAQKNFPGIIFQQMSVESLDFPDFEFDVVYSRDVLEHVDNPIQAMAEMARVLAPYGKLIIKIPAEKSEHWLLKIRPSYFEEIHHLRIFSGTGLEDLVTQFGFRLLKKEPQGFLDHFFLYFLFKSTTASETQLALGTWKEHWWGWFVAPIHAFLKPELVFHTWLKYVPIWVVTLPIGYAINFVGNRFLPKSVYYEFSKTL
ncbi:MAG TPA: class I SAM-dependent methyltransferase [Patescibacteria group bacterium]|jgi:SAM-dependent methyltransferase|nr:class I SAM-dependent methyltransferase [Patescibacteria group bacterium]